MRRHAIPEYSDKEVSEARPNGSFVAERQDAMDPHCAPAEGGGPDLEEVRQQESEPVLGRQIRVMSLDGSSAVVDRAVVWLDVPFDDVREVEEHYYRSPSRGLER